MGEVALVYCRFDDSCGVFVGLLCKVACNGPSVSLPAIDPSTTTLTATLILTPHHNFRVGVPELVAAVSNAGGLGILTALTQPNPNALREAIRKTRKLTNKNFGVNITLLPSINPPDYEGYARAAVEEGVKVFETAGNNRELLYHSFGGDVDAQSSWSPHQVLQTERMHRDPQM